jgi:YVTN family beta-propeller protein
MANSLMLAAAPVQRVAEARVLGEINVGRGPIGDIAVDAGDATLVATNSADGSVAIVDADQLKVDAVVPLGGEPFAVAAAGGRAFVGVSAPTHDLIDAVDTRAMGVVRVAARYDGDRLFVGATTDDAVKLARIDVESGRVDTARVAGPESTVDALRISPNGRLVYVATSDTTGGTLSVVDAATARIVASMPTVSPIRDLVVRGDGRVAYVLGSDPQYGGLVEMIDIPAKRPFDIAWIGGHPIQFALAADGTRMYVVYRDAVAVLCLITNEIVDTLAVDAQPSCVATSPDGTRLYVADYSGRITVFAVAARAPFDDVLDVETVAMSEVRELEPAGA